MLATKTKEICEGMNELMGLCAQQLFSIDTLNSMTIDEMRVFQKTMSLMSNCMELMVEQASMMDAMDDKLNQLLAK